MMKYLRTLFLIHKRVKQKATLYSLLVTILLFGLFLEAYMHNFNLVYITLFFVFALAFTAGPVGTFNIARLRTLYEGTSRLFANEEGVLYIGIENPTRYPSWALWLESETVKTEIGNVGALSKKRAKIKVTPLKRGMWTLPEITMQSLFPLSTVRFVTKIDQHKEGVVYPAPAGESLQQFLNRQKAHFGEETDFDGIKVSQGQQLSSRIHWPSVAKGVEGVKHFIHERPVQVLRFEFQNAGKNDEARLSQLTKWVLECEKAALPFEVLMPGQLLQFPKESVDEILEHFAKY